MSRGGIIILVYLLFQFLGWLFALHHPVIFICFNTILKTRYTCITSYPRAALTYANEHNCLPVETKCTNQLKLFLHYAKSEYQVCGPCTDVHASKLFISPSCWRNSANMMRASGYLLLLTVSYGCTHSSFTLNVSDQAN